MVHFLCVTPTLFTLIVFLFCEMQFIKLYIEGLKNSEGFEAFIYVPPVDSPQRYRFSFDRSGSSKNATLPQNVDVECCY